MANGKQTTSSELNDSLATSNTVYVGNLAWSVQWQELKDHMRSAGEVEHVDILMEGRGRSKGCAIVKFQTVEDAQNAIDTLNNTELNGRSIFIREDREKRSTSKNSNCRVYVGNLSWNVKWQDLKDHMKEAGEVVHADVLESYNGRSRGCGLVEYSTEEEAQNAIDTLHDTELDGRMIFVREDREPNSGSIGSFAKGGSRQNNNSRSHQNYDNDNGGNTKLYVGNLSFETTWQDLKDHFSAFGQVEFAEVIEGNDGRSRGFGLVRYLNQDDANTAIKELNQTDFDGRTIEVRYDRRR